MSLFTNKTPTLRNLYSQLIAAFSGTYQLMAQMLYGTGIHHGGQLFDFQLSRGQGYGKNVAADGHGHGGLQGGASGCGHPWLKTLCLGVWAVKS